MKITDLQTFIVGVPGADNTITSNWMFVKVHTDAGITGLGEGHVASKEPAVASAVEALARNLIGQDPARIEGLWQSMYRRPRWRGGPVLASAISAVEIALWDIKGKALGVPIYQLLGGACRDRIRLYTHISGDSPAGIAGHAREMVEAGFNGLKMTPDWVDEHGVVALPAPIPLEVERVRAVRDAVGDRVDIMVDAHGRLTLPQAADMGRRMEELDILFFEEAAPPEDVDALEWLSRQTSVPQATGERLFGKWAFAEIINRHLVNYVQPDVVHVGGILEMKKIAAMAESRFVEMAPHNPQSPVSTMASLHIDACSPACVIQEYVHLGPDLQSELFGGGPVIRDGYATLPDRPGLGIELNEAVAARYPYAPIDRPDWSWEDGAVAEW